MSDQSHFFKGIVLETIEDLYRKHLESNGWSIFSLARYTGYTRRGLLNQIKRMPNLYKDYESNRKRREGCGKWNYLHC